MVFCALVGSMRTSHWPAACHVPCISHHLEAVFLDNLPSCMLNGTQAVEAAAADIWQEFQQVTSDPEGLAARGNSIWVAAARDEALA